MEITQGCRMLYTGWSGQARIPVYVVNTSETEVMVQFLTGPERGFRRWVSRDTVKFPESDRFDVV